MREKFVFIFSINLENRFVKVDRLDRKMIPEHILNMLYCGLSSENKHFSENPISLSCDHLVCKKCVTRLQQQQVICGECGKKSKVELNSTKESSLFKVSFQSYANDLFEIICEKFENNIYQLKSK